MEFRYMFKTAPDTIFAVDNRTIGDNDFASFNTSVYQFNEKRNNFLIAGQAQEELLQEGSVARNFYEKWKSQEFATLDDSTLNNVMSDLETLKQEYSYDELITDATFKGTEYSSAMISMEDAVSLINEEMSLENILADVESRKPVNETSSPEKEQELEF